MFKTIDSTYGTEKLVSRSRAKVIDNIDPLSRGRIRVNSPILGETVWIPYLTAPGMFSVPDIDDIVYIEADGGYETHPVAWGNFTKGADATPDIPEEFQKFNPTNRGFYTPNGILVELDDTVLTAGVRITTAAGIKLNLDDVTDTVTLETVSGNSFTVEPTGITVEDSFGNTLTTSEEGIKLEEPAGAELNLSLGKVALGGHTAELLDLFSQLLSQLNTLTTSMEIETHTGNLGYPTSPPLNAAVYAAVQAQIVIIQTLLTTIKGTL